ncbi:MAG: hypothetical protein WDM96_12765 [Lacunisphaera sp.]
MLLDEVRQLPQVGRNVERILHYAETLEKCSSFCLHLAESWRQTTKHAGEVDIVDLYATAVDTKTVLFFGTNRVDVTGAKGRGHQWHSVRNRPSAAKPDQKRPRGRCQSGRGWRATREWTNHPLD